MTALGDVSGTACDARLRIRRAVRRRTLPKGQRPGWLDDRADNDVLRVWYGEELGDRIIKDTDRRWRRDKRLLIGLGLAFVALMLYSALR